MTCVTARVRFLVVTVQAAVGSPAAPWHSRIVTLARPPLPVNVLVIVIAQIRPRPGVLSTPLLHEVVGPKVAALAPLVKARDPMSRSEPVSRVARERRMGITLVELAAQTR